MQQRCTGTPALTTKALAIKLGFTNPNTSYSGGSGISSSGSGPLPVMARTNCAVVSAAGGSASKTATGIPPGMWNARGRSGCWIRSATNDAMKSSVGAARMVFVISGRL